MSTVEDRDDIAEPQSSSFNDLSAYTYIPFEYVQDHSSKVFDNHSDKADLKWYAAHHRSFAYKSIDHAEQMISALGWFYKAYLWAEHDYLGDFRFRLNLDFYTPEETEKVIEHAHELFTQLDKLFPWLEDVLYKEWSAIKRSTHHHRRGEEFLSKCFGLFAQYPELGLLPK